GCWPWASQALSCTAVLLFAAIILLGAALFGFRQKIGIGVSPTASLNLLDRPLMLLSATRASRQRVRQSPREADTQRGDRVRHVALRTQWRILWVDNHREGKIACLARCGPVLRGESSPSRRSGIRRLPHKELRDDGNHANRDLRNGRGRPLV